jgi:hypothetical protein
VKSRTDHVTDRRLASEENGAVLALVLLLTGFLLLLGAALLTIASSERQVGVNDRSSTQALYLAETAVERARRLLPRYAVNDLLTDNLLLGEWVHGASMPTGTYRAVVTNNVAGLGGHPPDSGTALCGATTCDTDRLVVVTGIGSAQNAVKVVRALLEIPSLLKPPAPITMANPDLDPVFEGESFLVSGFDRNLGGGEGSSPARPAIAVLTGEAASTILGTLSAGQQGRVVGAGATPSVAAVASSDTSDSSQRLKLQLARQADRLFVDPGTIIEDLRGNDATGQVSLVKADPSADPNQGLDTAGDVILDGSGRGSGILVVTGQLTLRGSYRFDGLVLLVGDGSRLSLEGDATIFGSVIIANRTARNVGRGGLAVKDRAQLHFSQEALHLAGRFLSASLRAWQEVSPSP